MAWEPEGWRKRVWGSFRPPHSWLEWNEPRHHAVVWALMPGLVPTELGFPSPSLPWKEHDLWVWGGGFLGGGDFGVSGVFEDSDFFLVSSWGGSALSDLPVISSSVKAVPCGTCTCCTYGVLPEEATPAPGVRSGKGSSVGVGTWGGLTNEVEGSTGDSTGVFPWLPLEDRRRWRRFFLLRTSVNGSSARSVASCFSVTPSASLPAAWYRVIWGPLGPWGRETPGGCCSLTDLVCGTDGAWGLLALVEYWCLYGQVAVTYRPR